MTRSINLIKKNHYRGLKHLQNTLDNFFSDAWWPTQTNELWEEFQLFSKLSEDKENYYLEVDLPGVKKEDVKIEVENNTLRIQGERKGEEKKDEVKRHYSEVFYGSFIRDYNLPNTVNSNNIKARYVDGVLNITIPKSPESKAQTIKIE